MKRIHGFTLIELMITVAVLGIIAAIAVPAYNNYVTRGKLTEAFGTLSDFRVRMEQFYVDNRNYGVAGGACGVTSPTGQYFTYTCVVGNPASTYIATATNKSGVGLAASGAYVYTINEAGTQNTTTFAGGSGTSGSWRSK